MEGLLSTDPTQSSLRPNSGVGYLAIFAMAKIRRIGHDLQIPFLPWPRSEGSAMTFRYPFFLVVVVLVVLVVLVGFQA